VEERKSDVIGGVAFYSHMLVISLRYHIPRSNFVSEGYPGLGVVVEFTKKCKQRVNTKAGQNK
jgi:hypothetical protein